MPMKRLLSSGLIDQDDIQRQERDQAKVRDQLHRRPCKTFVNPIVGYPEDK